MSGVMKFKKRSGDDITEIDRDELIYRASSVMESKHYNHKCQARFIKMVCDQVSETDNPMFKFFKPSFIYKNNPAWSTAFKIILDFLDLYQLNHTKDAVLRELRDYDRIGHAELDYEEKDAFGYLEFLCGSFGSDNKFEENVERFAAKCGIEEFLLINGATPPRSPVRESPATSPLQDKMPEPDPEPVSEPIYQSIRGPDPDPEPAQELIYQSLRELEAEEDDDEEEEFALDAPDIQIAERLKDNEGSQDLEFNIHEDSAAADGSENLQDKNSLLDGLNNFVTDMMNDNTGLDNTGHDNTGLGNTDTDVIGDYDAQEHSERSGLSGQFAIGRNGNYLAAAEEEEEDGDLDFGLNSNSFSAGGLVDAAPATGRDEDIEINFDDDDDV